MFRHCLIMCGLFLAATTLSVILIPDSSFAADDLPEKVAGRTVGQWTMDLASDNEIVRARAAKALGPFGKNALSALEKGLNDKSPAVQYWACYHLGRLSEDAKSAIARLKVLQKNEQSVAIQMAASFALCNIESVEPNIGYLTKNLSGSRGLACSAAELLGEIGPKAKSAIPKLEEAFVKNGRGPGAKKGDYHINGACQNALRKIQKDWKPPK